MGDVLLLCKAELMAVHQTKLTGSFAILYPIKLKLFAKHVLMGRVGGGFPRANEENPCGCV